MYGPHLVLVDMYGPPLSLEDIQVALYLTLQWCFNDIGINTGVCDDFVGFP